MSARVEQPPAGDEILLFRTSPAQQRLWLLDQLDPAGSNYLIAGALHLRGELSVPALEQALNDVVALHEALRTGFIAVDGTPWQAVEMPSRLPLASHDLSQFAPAAKQHEALRLAAKMATERFDLQRPPLLRVQLLRLSSDDWQLGLCVHHIVCDGPSLAQLFADVAAAYAHRLDPARSAPPAPRLQLADYAEWQHEQAQTAAGQAALTFWRSRLLGVPDLDAPLDHARPALRAARGARHPISLDAGLRGRVEHTARINGSTPFTILLAAWGMTVARWSGQAEFAIGTPVSARNQTSLEGAVGFFAETTALRFSAHDDPDMATLWRQAHAAWSELLTQPPPPFDQLLQTLDRGLARDRTPLFQTLFSLNPALHLPPLPGLSLQPVSLPLGQAKTDLVLELEEHPQGYLGSLEYDAALFDAGHMAALGSYFARVLDAALLDPCGRLSNLPLPPGRPQSPATADHAAGQTAPAGRNPCMEQIVAEVWRELLGDIPLTADSQFFEIGGHSLLAAKVVARLRQRLGLAIPMSVLFDHPGLGELAALLHQLATGHAAENSEPAPVPTDIGLAPLSPAQARLWFIQQLDPGATAYHLFAAAQLDGPLDVDLLAQALALLVTRQHSLRTRFIDHAGVPAQELLPAPPITLQPRSLAGLDADAQAQAMATLAREESQRPFALDEAPPWRAQLLRLAPERHVFCLTVHHILADGWSLDILWRELGQHYQDLRQQRPPRLAAPPLQYSDYARWRQTGRNSAEERRQIAAWREALSGLPSLQLIPDRRRPERSSHAGGHCDLRLSSTAVAALDGLAQRAGTTRFVASLALFAALLSRWTNQTDFAIGVPVAGRDRDDLENLIGCFINLLPVRVSLAEAADFGTLTATIKHHWRAVMERQDVPFERLIEAMRPAGDDTGHPLFQVLFNYQHSEIHTSVVDGLELRPLDLPGGVSQFDLALYLDDSADGLRGRFIYRSELFETATIARIAGAYSALLEAAADGDAEWTTVELASAADRQLLATWNDTKVDYGPARLLDDLIAEQVARSPGATAVTADDGVLDFAGLLRRADALAGRLRAAGAGPGQVVAVYLPRGIDLPVALLAVLRAGAAYLPLDPDLPADRLAFMLDDATPTALISDATNHLKCPAGLPLLLTDAADDDGADAETDGEAGAWPARAPDDIAYVIYTSGSTGKPKGVMVSHRAIVNRLRWMQCEYPLGAADRVVQKTPCGFDVSVWEFFWPMLSGAELVMARPGGHRDPDYLAQLFEQRRISVVHFVPSMLEIFLATAELGRCAHLRLLFTSGEVLPPHLRDRCLDGLPHAALHNLYGPTEAAIDVTFWPCTAEQRDLPVPIGRPVANTRIHVLDSRGQPTPIGVSGEICIAGVQVSLGYLRRPALDAERFVEDPFTGSASARMYRTGDLGRWRDGGWIEYLGRGDHQIKLRGQRIELGEIEATLREHPEVRDAVVLLLGEGLHTHLEGFVLSAVGPLDPTTLRAWLSQRLSAIMVPSRIHAVDSFPLTVSGKTDRHALAARVPAAATPPTAGEPDGGIGTVLRQRVAAIWCEVLGLPQVDPHGNFFEVGGNSLLLVQVHARLRRDFDDPPSLLELFRFPTVAALAARLDVRSPPARAEAAAVTAISTDEPIAIVGMAGRFPGADSVEELWQLLLDGRSGLRVVSREEALADGADPSLLDHPAYVPYAAPLNGIGQFDEQLFGYSPADAALLDPQGRWLLQCAWEALEHAAIDPRRVDGGIGVFAGATVSSYALHALRDHPLDQSLAQRVLFANDKDYIASRIAYKLGLNGPAIGVQTACSSSLVAVALAVDALRRGDCAVALAGGASINVPHRVGYLYEDGSILSPNGQCRAFDAGAAGTVAGNGVAVIALKRLSAALADGDPIHAVIRGIAVNNDGADKLGFSAPSAAGQEAVLRTALGRAGLRAEQIGYVEAHGTGTRLGDEVELSALDAAYATATPRTQRCRLGSLKSNIGHLDAAAGIAGLIKAVLAVEHGVLPPTLHVSEPNPRLRDAAASFELVTRTGSWDDIHGPRRAGISSFGIGGTNVHCIIEQPPARPAMPGRTRTQLLLLSAADAAALSRQRERLLDALALEPHPALDAVAWTLQRGRRALPWRLAVAADELPQARQHLRQARLPTQAAAAPAVYLLFPGQGSQSRAMGAQLFAEQRGFRAEVEHCLDLLPVGLAQTLRTCVFSHRSAGTEDLRDTALAQPALFVLEYALARWLLELGVRPAGLLGHSLGELSAAAVAGVLPLADALRLVVARGRLMQQAPRGAMLQVAATVEQLSPRLPTRVAIAALNTPALTVLSGPRAAIETCAAELAAAGFAVQPLAVEHAFHSPLMHDAAQALGETLLGLAPAPAQIPLLSNLSGDWMDSNEALDADRWMHQIEQPVRFADGLRRIAERDPHALLLEVGPGRALSGFARSFSLGCLPLLADVAHAPYAACRGLLQSLGDAWQAGTELDWRGLLDSSAPTPIALPSYPFAGHLHWLRPTGHSDPHLATMEWHRAPRPQRDKTIGRIGLYGGDSALLDRVTGRMQAAGVTVRRLANLAEVRADERLLLFEPDLALVLNMARELAGKPPQSLLLVTRDAQDDGLNADAAMAAAAALSLAQELPELRLRQVDLAGADEPHQLTALCDECLADGPASTLLRDGQRRLPRAQRLPDAAPVASPWRAGAVVLITGGYGRLGMRFAEQLARRGDARLVLLGRHACANDDQQLRRLREQGAQLLTLEGDIAVDGVASHAVQTAREKFGALHAVIHAAGIIGEAALTPMLENRNIDIEDVWKAKRQGTSLLADALSSLTLDYVLLCSSIASVLGGLGFAAYAAGNRWMEVFAQRQNRRGGTPWLALAYDGLRDGGPAGSSISLDPQQTMALTEQALAAGLSGRVLALAGALEKRLDRWASPAAHDSETIDAAPRSAIADHYADPVQAQVAQAMASVLGLAQLAPDEDFFTLGGDSLVATRLVAKLRAATGLPLSVGLVLRAPTVRLLAATIASLQGEHAGTSALDEDLEEGSL